MNGTIYRINYHALADELKSANIFASKSLQNRYIDEWIEVLKECDIASCQDFYDKDVRAHMEKENIEAPERFQVPIHYHSTSAFIHFRVSRIIEMLHYSKISTDFASDIDISDFSRDTSNICWTPATGAVPIKKEPILLAPLTIGRYYRWIVIDGNHRISDAICHNKGSIKGYYLDAGSLVENNMLCTAFDKFLYIFQNEVTALASYRILKDIDDDSLYHLSYLHSGKVHFYR